MKRVYCFVSCVISILIAICLASCAPALETPTESKLNIGQPGYIGTSDEAGSAFDPALKPYVDKIITELGDTVPHTNITVTCEVDQFSVSIIINGQCNITYFGNHIVKAKSAFETVFSETERDSLAVVLADDESNLIAYFNHDVGEIKAGAYGLLADRRLGASKYTALDSIEALCELFPATYTFIGKSKVEPSALLIYEEVMEILSEQYNRPEDEILAELAPQYNMTADELKKLIQDVMSDIYS